MLTDIFDFWAQIAPDAKKHPADENVFARVINHGFDLEILPGCFMGPLRTAPVVLLFLSPGLSEEDKATPEIIEWHLRTRAGNESLVSEAIHPPAYRWWAERTAIFGKPKDLADKIAVLNIGAYHSKTFTDHGMLAALPSSRVSLDWAQYVLFPQAEAGERVVICLRAAKFWGLECGRRYKGTLFAPRVTRGGHIHNTYRQEIIQTVQRAIAV